MTNNQQILPCPFCDYIPSFRGPFQRDDRRRFVIIPDCECHDMEIYCGNFRNYSIETGIKNWNNRIKLSNRDRAIWKAALTLAHNLCIQKSNEINNDDGPLDVVNALSNEAKRIKGWLNPEEDQLLEMFREAGVPN